MYLKPEAIEAATKLLKENGVYNPIHEDIAAVLPAERVAKQVLVMKDYIDNLPPDEEGPVNPSIPDPPV